MDNIHRILDKALEEDDLAGKLLEVMKKPIKMKPLEQKLCVAALKGIDLREKVEPVNKKKGILLRGKKYSNREKKHKLTKR